MINMLFICFGNIVIKFSSLVNTGVVGIYYILSSFQETLKKCYAENILFNVI